MIIEDLECWYKEQRRKKNLNTIIGCRKQSRRYIEEAVKNMQNGKSSGNKHKNNRKNFMDSK